MEIYQQQLIRKFSETLQASWETYKATHELAEDPNLFIAYLIDNQIIKDEIIRKYTILKEFNEKAAAYKTKSELIQLLSQRYNLSTRVIWKYIKQ